MNPGYAVVRKLQGRCPPEKPASGLEDDSDMNPVEPLSPGLGTSDDPYAPPRTELEHAQSRLSQDADLDRLRCAYLDQETAIRRVSWLNFTLALVWMPAAIGTLLMSGLMLLRAVGIDPVNYQFPKDTPPGIGLLALTGFHVGCLVLNIVIWRELRRFRPWARWADGFLAIVFLFIFLVYAGDVLINHKPLAWLIMISVPGLAVSTLVLLTLFSPRSSVVFSKQYREIVALQDGKSQSPRLKSH